jgi:ABC-type phosphate transport system substrate-binding protein
MRTLAWVLAGCLLMLGSPGVRADIYVIVNKSNPVQSLTRKEVVDLFTGRSHTFANGDYALGFDLPRDSATRAEFYRALTGMSLAQLGSYWARLMFTGQTLPPQPLPGEDVMLAVVARNPGAIGYLGRPPAGDGVHVVFVIKTP